MFGNKLINTNAGGGCTNTVDLYNPFPDGGGVALYQLNGDATDVSGNYDGTASNVTYGAGEFGQAGVFNGTSSYIDLGSSVISANSSFSISHWVKFDNVSTTSGDRSIHIGNSDNASGISIFVINSTLYLRIVDNNGNPQDITYSPSNNVWYNLVITYDNSTKQFKGYVDNVLINTLTISGFTPLGNYGAIGSRIGSNGANQFLEGSIDQVRIFNRALRPYEVEALYTEEYCTPTIVPSEHFNTVLWTGDSVQDRSISGVGFAPDFTWIKSRTSASYNSLFDTVRGAGNKLVSNETLAEYGNSYGGVSVFESDGFALNSIGGTNLGDVNLSGNNYVAWNFKAGGAAVTNTDGTITSQVSANTEAGFSVVTWTGNGAANATVGHGLNNTPSLYITKRRNSTGNWVLFATTLLPTANAQEYLVLNAADASAGASQALPTSNILNVESVFDNIGSATYVSYCFAEVEGFSNFGSYVGTGTTEGQLVVTGFEPAFVMWKKTSNSTSAHWNIVDNKRSPLKDKNNVLYSNLSSAEDVTSYDLIDFNENGFQVKAPYSQFNESGATFIYMAFAADPTTIEPSLEDSFNTALYTSTGGSQSITGLGFQPDLLWTKNRTATWFHQIVDSVRLAPNTIYSNSTQAESTPVSYTSSLDTDGFTVNYTETIGSNYVAWAWKGAELPAINSDGSIPSVVSANPAAGFSIVSYKGTGNNTPITVGHGLGEDVIPAFIIVKYRNGYNWYAYHKDAGTNNYFEFNTTAAAAFSSVVFGNQTNGTIRLGGDYVVSRDTGNYIAYCFAEVAGFSKFGSYTGNAPAGGTGSTIPINCGFEPAFVMIKWTSGSVGYGAWGIWDNKRDTTNPNTKFLQANSTSAELDLSAYGIDFASNGFTVGAAGNDITNISGNSYIYMAFANQF